MWKLAHCTIKQALYPLCPSDLSSPFQKVSMTSLVLGSSNIVARQVSSPSIRDVKRTWKHKKKAQNSATLGGLRTTANLKGQLVRKKKCRAVYCREIKVWSHFVTHLLFFFLHRASDKRRNLAQQKAEAQRRLYGQGTMKKLSAGSSEWEKQHLTLERRKEELVRLFFFFLQKLSLKLLPRHMRNASLAVQGDNVVFNYSCSEITKAIHFKLLSGSSQRCAPCSGLALDWSFGPSFIVWSDEWM